MSNVGKLFTVMQSPEPNTSKPLTLGHWTVTFQCDVFPTDLFVVVYAVSSFICSKKKIFVLFQNTKYYCTAVGINPKLLLFSWLIIFRYRKVLQSCTAHFSYTSFLSESRCWQQLTLHWRGSWDPRVVLWGCTRECQGAAWEAQALLFTWTSPLLRQLSCLSSLGTPGSGARLPLAGRTAALPISVDLNHSLWFYQQREISEYSLQQAELKQQLLVLDTGKNRIHSWHCSAPLTWPMDCSSGQQTSPPRHFKLSNPALNGLLYNGQSYSVIARKSEDLSSETIQGRNNNRIRRIKSGTDFRHSYVFYPDAVAPGQVCRTGERLNRGNLHPFHIPPLESTYIFHLPWAIQSCEKYWLAMHTKYLYWYCTGTQGTQSRTKIVLEQPQHSLIVLILLLPDHSTSLSSLHLLFPISQLFTIIRKSKKQINTWVQSTHLLANSRINNLHITHLQSKDNWSLTGPFFSPLQRKLQDAVTENVGGFKQPAVFRQWYHSGRRRWAAGFLLVFTRQVHPYWAHMHLGSLPLQKPHG